MTKKIYRLGKNAAGKLVRINQQKAGEEERVLTLIDGGNSLDHAADDDGGGGDSGIAELIPHGNYVDNGQLPPMIVDADDDDDGGDSGIGEFKPGEAEPKPDKLKGAPREATPEMVIEQRLQEQKGHRHWAKVNVRERREYEGAPGPGLKQHPAVIFQSQRFDGIDRSLNPIFPMADAIAEFENARKEQELQKQLRNQNDLSNSNRASSAPTLIR